MRQFIEKLFIVILGLYASYIFYPQNDLVLFFLVSIILSLLLDLINPTRVRVFIYICFIGLCFFNKLFIPYLPLILYNMYIDLGIYSLSSFLLFFRDPNLVTIFAAFISLYLTITRDSFNRFTEDNKIVRDELKEDAIYLRKYNEQLKIDREKNIHIAILTERNRIAREMHDSIGHSISSSILQVEALKIVSNTSLDSLDLLQNTLSTGMDDIRRSIHNLYSDSLDLKKRIQTLCEEAISLDIDLDYRLEETLSYDFKFDILSIVRESITNCIKHSDGDKLSIKILTQPQFYSITIRDNGRSFIEKGSSSSQGMGLILMEEIARKYDGFINYEFREGFKIYITLMKG